MKFQKISMFAVLVGLLSVGIANATNGGMTVSNSPITSSGTISIGHSNVLSSAQTTQGVYQIKWEKRREEILNSDDKDFVELAPFYEEKGVFFIPEKARWSYIKDNANQPNLGILVDDALQLLEDNNDQLKGALPIGTYAKSSLPAEKFKALIDTIDKNEIDTIVFKVYGTKGSSWLYEDDGVSLNYQKYL